MLAAVWLHRLLGRSATAEQVIDTIVEDQRISQLYMSARDSRFFQHPRRDELFPEFDVNGFSAPIHEQEDRLEALGICGSHERIQRLETAVMAVAEYYFNPRAPRGDSSTSMLTPLTKDLMAAYQEVGISSEDAKMLTKKWMAVGATVRGDLPDIDGATEYLGRQDERLERFLSGSQQSGVIFTP